MMNIERVPGRRDLMGWRAYVTAPAPNGINVNDIADEILHLAERGIPQYGPVVAVEIREGRRFVDLTFSFPGFHQSAEINALRVAGPIFAQLGMAIDRVELSTCEP